MVRRKRRRVGSIEEAKERLKDAGRDLLCNLLYWKVAICRVLLYCFLGFGSTFVALTEVFGDQTWAEMGWFTKTRLILQCVLGAVPPLIAFFDSTISLLRGERGSGHTEFLTKR